MPVCLQVLMEKIIAIDKTVSIIFTDYSEALDSVSHCNLFEAFLEMGFPKHLEKAMRDTEVSKYGVKFGGTHISNLRYADDTALIARGENCTTYQQCK